MRRRHELTDEQWERLKPLLPAQKPKTGRPGKDHRQIINGILWILHTGAPWRDLPERFGPCQTVYSRFNKWRQEGRWQRLFEQVQTEAEQQGQIDGDVHFVDSSIVRAHQNAACIQAWFQAGAKKGARRH
jgi:transposase